MRISLLMDCGGESPLDLGRALRWVTDVLGSETVIRDCVPLKGGISSAVYGLGVTRNGGVQRLVLRLFTDEEWLRHAPDLAAHEAANLRKAETTGVPTPRLVAVDDSGSACGLPAVLMTRLPGAVVLRPPAVGPWLEGMAEALVRLHRTDAGAHPWDYFTYNDVHSLTTPTWSCSREMWDRALEAVRQPRPAARTCFIHRDYHPANVLWADDKVSGVVDWVNGCRGPAGIDLGHCRLNLALLCGPDVADQFLQSYRRLAGDAFTYDPFWDLTSAIESLPGPPEVYAGWTALGVTDLTPVLVGERYEEHVARIVGRLA